VEQEPLAVTVRSEVRPVRRAGDAIEMLDQRDLPTRERWIEMDTVAEVADGIRHMVIRGAPAIGIAAAFGVVFGVRSLLEESEQRVSEELVHRAEREVFAPLADTRPTAVNLFWALDRMRERLAGLVDDEVDADGVVEALFEEAEAIFESDRANNLEMARYGAALLPEGARVLTHCNTGGLATGGYGTALGVLRAAEAAGRLERVWIDETRPYLQGARLTAWECLTDEIPATLITDSMAAHFMQDGRVDAVIVGTDRVAANGDVANKIGTYGLAVLCRHHEIPFYVAAPLSTIDLEVASGAEIPIEQRAAREVTHVHDRPIAPEAIDVAHPAFDVTPAEYVSAIITERGVARAPYEVSLAALF
jgi:methylthioribose-1-phosphate isomerase